MKHRDKCCPICGELKFTEVAQRDRYGFKVSSLLCQECGIIFLSPRLALDEYGEFYTEKYRDLVSKYWKFEIDADMDSEEYGESIVQFLETCYAGFGGMCALDIGGSAGGVAAVLKDRVGLDVTVCDTNTAELARAKDKGLKTIEGTIEDSHIEGPWDFILMCRTIDHLFDPMMALRRVWENLDTNGWFFVDIVDWLCVARSEGIINSFHLDHPFNFTADSFREMLKSRGFSIVSEHISPEELGVNSGRIEHGFLCKKGRMSTRHIESDTNDLLKEIRKIQAEERREVVQVVTRR